MRGLPTTPEISSRDFLRPRTMKALDFKRMILRESWDLEETTCSWITQTSPIVTEHLMIMQMVKFKYSLSLSLSHFSIQIMMAPWIMLFPVSSLSTTDRILISRTFLGQILGRQSPSDFKILFQFCYCYSTHYKYSHTLSIKLCTYDIIIKDIIMYHYIIIQTNQNVTIFKGSFILHSFKMTRKNTHPCQRLLLECSSLVIYILHDLHMSPST